MIETVDKEVLLLIHIYIKKILREKNASNKIVLVSLRYLPHCSYD